MSNKVKAYIIRFVILLITLYVYFRIIGSCEKYSIKLLTAIGAGCIAGFISKLINDNLFNNE